MKGQIDFFYQDNKTTFPFRAFLIFVKKKFSLQSVIHVTSIIYLCRIETN